MKRQLLTYAIAVAVAFGAIVACTKRDSKPENLTLNNTQMSGPDDPSSIADCYTKFTNTLKNPPAGYTPGDAENAFTECANSFINLGGGGGRKLYPPAPPFPTGQIDPYFISNESEADLSGEREICEFFNMPYPLLLDGSQTMIYNVRRRELNNFNSAIADALHSQQSLVLFSARDKVNAVLNYMMNHPDDYVLMFDREKFFKYVTNVAFKYSTRLGLGTTFINFFQIYTVPGYELIYKEFPYR
ncbi:hypothetical protein HNQ91_001267 [Filimonas zeae]|uniref:Uncharacterized protein n=1 Tax=Filimonas zeae TaxID=1737353 RepID=A0A917IRP7_9BACT|nr:hypothetical protein [Filimonas zeae]MDR6338245.1 hypothetical protein [Filimonas zeae]GGH62453.1 hypothetical protein GCM10011379_12410 [Filimonas zeae]